MRFGGWLLATLGGLVGCNTGRISIGDDDAPGCTPEECGEAPAEAISCLNGSAGTFACERDVDDSCTWVALCPVIRCSSDDCGPAPAESPMCQAGMWGSVWACESVASPCSWNRVCPEDRRECSPMDCGVPPGDATDCAAEGMQGSSCLRDSGGSCQWTPVACRPP